MTRTASRDELRWLMPLLRGADPRAPSYSRRDVLNAAPRHVQLLLQLFPKRPPLRTELAPPLPTQQRLVRVSG